MASRADRTRNSLFPSARVERHYDIWEEFSESVNLAPRLEFYSVPVLKKLMSKTQSPTDPK